MVRHAGRGVLSTQRRVGGKRGHAAAVHVGVDLGEALRIRNRLVRVPRRRKHERLGFEAQPAEVQRTQGRGEGLGAEPGGRGGRGVGDRGKRGLATGREKGDAEQTQRTEKGSVHDNSWGTNADTRPVAGARVRKSGE